MTDSKLLSLTNGLVEKMERQSGNLQRDYNLICGQMELRDANQKFYNACLTQFKADGTENKASSYDELSSDDKTKFTTMVGIRISPLKAPSSTRTKWEEVRKEIALKLIKNGY